MDFYSAKVGSMTIQDDSLPRVKPRTWDTLSRSDTRQR